jgi:hypothetical protein
VNFGRYGFIRLAPGRVRISDPAFGRAQLPARAVLLAAGRLRLLRPLPRQVRGRCYDFKKNPLKTAKY